MRFTSFLNVLAVAVFAAFNAAAQGDLGKYGVDAEPLQPAYPDTFRCGKITSLFGSMFDLDGSKRAARHIGIDLGNLDDKIIAPADGTIRAIWKTVHPWGVDWNILFAHEMHDLNMNAAPFVYLLEFDHLQFSDIAHLVVGQAVRRGDKIGVVRHPGNNPNLRAEVHLELYLVPNHAQFDLIWSNDLGFLYWRNEAAHLIDPVFLLSLNAPVSDGKAYINMFEPKAGRDLITGLTYPLAC